MALIKYYRFVEFYYIFWKVQPYSCLHAVYIPYEYKGWELDFNNPFILTDSPEYKIILKGLSAKFQSKSILTYWQSALFSNCILIAETSCTKKSMQNREKMQTWNDTIIYWVIN